MGGGDVAGEERVLVLGVGAGGGEKRREDDGQAQEGRAQVEFAAHAGRLEKIASGVKNNKQPQTLFERHGWAGPQVCRGAPHLTSEMWGDGGLLLFHVGEAFGEKLLELFEGF